MNEGHVHVIRDFLGDKVFVYHEDDEGLSHEHQHRQAEQLQVELGIGYMPSYAVHYFNNPQRYLN